MSSAVPAAIERFIDTTNAGDSAGFLESFTEDGFLSDWGRDFSGRNEIGRWNRSDNIGVQAQLLITRIELVGGDYHARVMVRGNGFNGEGGMVFTLHGDRIARLVIS